MQQFDIVVVGGGMVGLASALALVENSELKVAVLERGPAASEPTAEAGLRVSAINHKSMALLKRLGAWPEQRLAHYADMQVWDKDNLGQIHFSASDIGQQQIGAIVENDVIRWHLWQQAASHDQISLLPGSEISDINYGDNDIFVQRKDDAPVLCKLVIAADGAKSFLRQSNQIPLTFWHYDQHAIIANIDLEHAHGACARQVFLPTGPLALLPLANEKQCSIVWSTSPDEADKLMAMDAQAFDHALTAASDGVLGNLNLASKRACFPLMMRYARHFVQDKLVLVGDAAHTIHPLAGQGVNLGFADVESLATHLHQAVKQGQGVNSPQSLRRYERERKAAATEMIATMEGFKRLFSNSHPVLRGLRGIGMSLFDRVTPLKNWCVKQALNG